MADKYTRFSKGFSDIASLVIIDGEITKCRDDISKLDIETEIANRNKVVVQTKGYLKCYFKKDDTFLVLGIIDTLPNPRLANQYIEIIND